MSAVGVGYEPKAYVWIGYGVWAQLWASWALPLAWGFTWRAMSSRRAVLPAVVFVALTVALHFETGYLALIPHRHLPLPGAEHVAHSTGARRRTGRRRRAARLGVGDRSAAWSRVVGRPPTRVLAHTPLVNGYGAKQVMSWLVRWSALRRPPLPGRHRAGRRRPRATCIVRWRTEALGSSNRGVAGDELAVVVRSHHVRISDVLLPGSTDIFMRRFMMGAQLAALYLAGIGGVGGGASRAAPRGSTVAPRAARGGRESRSERVALVAVGAASGVAVLAPAWTQIDTFGVRQHAGDQRSSSAADALPGRRRRSPHRLHARPTAAGACTPGCPRTGGRRFTVGAVPVFKYLESRDVDEVGYTLRTASLMTDPEYFFDEDQCRGLRPLRRPLLDPAGRAPTTRARPARHGRGPVPALGPAPRRVRPGGRHRRGAERRSQTDVGIMSVPYLRSDLPGAGRYLAVAYGGAPAAPLTCRPCRRVTGAAGAVRTEHDDLADGQRHRHRGGAPDRGGGPERLVRPGLVRARRRATGLGRDARAGATGGAGRSRGPRRSRSLTSGSASIPSCSPSAVLTLAGFVRGGSTAASQARPRAAPGAAG